MERSPALIVAGTHDKLTCSPSEGITTERDNAVQAAKTITKVETPDEAEKAAASIRELRGVRKAVENMEDVVKGPINKFKTELIATVKSFLMPSITEEGRLDRLVKSYERTRMLEVEAQQRAAETQSVTLLDRQKELQDELDKAKALGAKAQAAKLEEDLIDAQLAAEDLPDPNALALKTAGVSAKKKLDYELRGETNTEKTANLWAFCQAFPHLCKIELKRAEILRVLNEGDCFRSEFPEEQPGNGGLPRPPGLRIFETIQTRY